METSRRVWRAHLAPTIWTPSRRDSIVRLAPSLFLSGLVVLLSQSTLEGEVGVSDVLIWRLRRLKLGEVVGVAKLRARRE